MSDYSNPLHTAIDDYIQAYINERYGINIWKNNPNINSNNNNNNNNSDVDDPWGLFGKNFAKGLLSDPIGGVASIWNTYNAWRNDRADLNMKKEYFNMHKDAYQNNERRTEQAFQEHRANRYGNML